MATLPPVVLQLQKKFSALLADEGLGPLSNKAAELAETEPCSSTRMKWWVVPLERLPAAGDGGSHLAAWRAVWGALLLAGALDWGCCWKFAKAWLILELLPSVAFLCEHQLSCQRTLLVCWKWLTQLWKRDGPRGPRTWRPRLYYSWSCWCVEAPEEKRTDSVCQLQILYVLLAARGFGFCLYWNLLENWGMASKRSYPPDKVE